jgi:hypothetical protein
LQPLGATAFDRAAIFHGSTEIDNTTEIHMKPRVFFSILAILGAFTSCAHMDPHPMDMTNAIQNAKTRADHLALARHYEAVAKSMRLKARENEKKLGEYEMHPYYGTRALDLKAHCRASISNYKHAAEINMNMAKSHRQMAEQIKK